jgi:hypothetical protein
MLEAMAQLTSFYCGKADEDDDRFIGFGGLDAVKFRRTVVPGDRLVLVARAVSIRPRRAVFDAQGWVNGQLCVESQITGVRVWRGRFRERQRARRVRRRRRTGDTGNSVNFQPRDRLEIPFTPASPGPRKLTKLPVSPIGSGGGYAIIGTARCGEKGDSSR